MPKCTVIVKDTSCTAVEPAITGAIDQDRAPIRHFDGSELEDVGDELHGRRGRENIWPFSWRMFAHYLFAIAMYIASKTLAGANNQNLLFKYFGPKKPKSIITFERVDQRMFSN